MLYYAQGDFILDIKKLANRELSKNMVADYKPFTSIDGDGFRCALYVSGCVFNCRGCYNKSIQDFGIGTPYTLELENKIINDLKHEGVKGLSILGGEPMLNVTVVDGLVKRFISEFKDKKDIWIWTGYTWEELMESISYDTELSKKQKSIIESIDVLVDGRYISEQEGWSTGKIKFRGSWNQRIINVKESLAQNKVILMKEFM